MRKGIIFLGLALAIPLGAVTIEKATAQCGNCSTSGIVCTNSCGWYTSCCASNGYCCVSLPSSSGSDNKPLSPKDKLKEERDSYQRQMDDLVKRRDSVQKQIDDVSSQLHSYDDALAKVSK